MREHPMRIPSEARANLIPCPCQNWCEQNPRLTSCFSTWAMINLGGNCIGALLQFLEPGILPQGAGIDPD